MPPRRPTPAPTSAAAGGGERFVALFRGINVGKAKRVAMADLRAAVESLGYTGVATLLNSGNLVFTAPRAAVADVAERIQRAVLARTGVSSRVTVLDAAAVARIVAENPLGDAADNHSRLFVAVFTEPGVRAGVLALAERDWGAERLAVGSLAAYLWCPEGALESVLPAEVGRVTRDASTTRNWATMLKLAGMLEGE